MHAHFEVWHDWVTDWVTNRRKSLNCYLLLKMKINVLLWTFLSWIFWCFMKTESVWDIFCWTKAAISHFPPPLNSDQTFIIHFCPSKKYFASEQIFPFLNLFVSREEEVQTWNWLSAVKKVWQRILIRVSALVILPGRRELWWGQCLSPWTGPWRW